MPNYKVRNGFSIIDEAGDTQIGGTTVTLTEAYAKRFQQALEDAGDASVAADFYRFEPKKIITYATNSGGGGGTTSAAAQEVRRNTQTVTADGAIAVGAIYASVQAESGTVTFDGKAVPVGGFIEVPLLTDGSTYQASIPYTVTEGQAKVFELRYALT